MNKTKILMICAISVALNVVLGEAVSMLSTPLLFLDTIGTIFIAANYGIGYGILTGIATNVLMIFFSGSLKILFALVNVAVANVVGLCAKGGFTYKKSTFSRYSTIY